LFEGLKAYRKSDGSVLLFRPLENAMRMQTGAERMCMPAPPVEQFVDAVKQTVLANKRWVSLLSKMLDHFHSSYASVYVQNLIIYQISYASRCLLLVKVLCIFGHYLWGVVLFLVWHLLLSIHSLFSLPLLGTTLRFVSKF
jgi:hypothetical protein